MLGIEKNSSKKCLCPLEDILNVISRKWSLLIIAVIGSRSSIRFSEILRLLPGLTPKILARRLKELESIGLVYRIVYADTPPRVEYRLSSRGRELRRLIKPLIEWAASRNPQVYKNSPCLN